MSEESKDRAAARAEELIERRADLQHGQPTTETDAQLAAERAEESRDRAAAAHRSAAVRHDESAQTHERVALVHEDAIDAGVGDADEHREAAALAPRTGRRGPICCRVVSACG
ncbi:hypothetical protein [Mycobacterium kyorinense]|uniref:hypothetical protein n=1 Tax=Mycobacterium kyorinense TaxID=487514 RepID=UPI0009ED5E8C|nr:hypothetical protein [Mycobacterium kyorinense]